jgi:hypothetical protein
LTEKELLDAITGLAAELGVRLVHLHDSRRATPDTKGLPDVFLCGKRACCWRELKPSGGQPRGTQKSWLFWLTEAGQDAGTWHPADWHSGRIAEELAALNGDRAEIAESADPDSARAFYRALYGKRR